MKVLSRVAFVRRIDGIENSASFVEDDTETRGVAVSVPIFFRSLGESARELVLANLD